MVLTLGFSHASHPLTPCPAATFHSGFTLSPASAHERKADDGRRDGQYGGTRKSPGPQQDTTKEMGEGRRAAASAGPGSLYPIVEAARQEQEPGGVCHYFGRFGAHHRATRGPKEGESRIKRAWLIPDQPPSGDARRPTRHPPASDDSDFTLPDPPANAQNES